MMKKRIIIFWVLSLILTAAFMACEKEDDDKESKESTFTSSESHETGNDCLKCHKPGGQGEITFNAGGTVFDSLGVSPWPGATIKLFSGSNGTGSLVKSIQVDKLGNFYTTASIAFGSGIYPSVTGPSKTSYMSFSVTTGACNSCHGVTTDPIKAF